MHVLILSCNTGQGHNSTANAIKEHFAKRGAQCDVCDSLKLISHGVSAFMSKGHTFMYRNLPWLFQWGYRYFEQHTKMFSHTSILYKFFGKGAKKNIQFME